MTRSERYENSAVLFQKGYNNADVARKLRVAPDTAARYRARYERSLQNEGRDNSRQFTDVLTNTVRSWKELDLLVRDAWKALDRRASNHFCEECECHVSLKPTDRAALHKSILTATDKKMRLAGVLGVKQEYFAMVAKIQNLQQRLILFMQTSLCSDCRAKLDIFMDQEIGEIGPAVIDAEAFDQPA